MARITGETGGGNALQAQSVTAQGQDHVAVPDPDYIANAEILRDGQDLVLRHPDGSTFTIEGYFSADPAPMIVSPQGAALTPEMVQSFVIPMHAQQYAQLDTASDESPVGHVAETSGHVTVTHADGSVEIVANGAPIYEGDIIETDGAGAVNILFVDETSFAVSNNARLAIDEYIFDPSSQSGETHFSVLRGMFVFVSGLIGRDDPDDVLIHTPVGSIGIRGTTIAGNVDTGEITVVEGAIVLRMPDGHTEMTLAAQFETARFNAAANTIEPVNVNGAADIDARFESLHSVMPGFFAQIEAPDNAAPGTAPAATDPVPSPANNAPAPANTAPADDTPASPAPASHDAQPQSGGAVTGGNAAPANTTPATATAAPEPVPPAGYNETSFDGQAQSTLPASSGGSTAPLTGTAASGGATGGSSVGATSTTGTGSSAGATTGTATNTGATGSGSTANPTVPAPPPSVTGAHGGTANGGGTTVTGPVAPVEHNLASLSGSQGFHINGATGQMLGAAIAATGDSDRDGHADFMAATGMTGAQAIFYNHTGAAMGSEGLSSPGQEASVAYAGDMDGDGYGDLIFGTPLAMGGAGFTEIQTGSGSVGFTNIPTGYNFGASVAGLGDLNGDGYSDVIIGAPGASADAGKAMILMGGDNMPTTIHFEDTTPANGTPDFVDDGQGYVIFTGITGGLMGTDVAGIGDFDNDGYSDFAISSPGQGTVYLGFGSENGPAGSLMTVSGLGASSVDSLQVYALGDMNGDGISDVGIADPTYNADQGRLHVLYGHAGADGDSYNVAGGVSGGNGFTIALDSGDPGQLVGAGSAGDFNGDGYSDIAVAVRTGTALDVYVVYGHTGMSGTIILNDAFLGDAENVYWMSYDLGVAGVSSPSTNPVDISLTSAGDLNGDGRDDLLIGMPHNQNNRGEVLAVYGADEGGAVTAGSTATAAGQSLTGTAGNDTLSDGGMGNVSLRGGDGDDTLLISSADPRHIDGGGGMDIMQFMRSNGTLDLSAMGSEKVNGIERMIMGGNAQTLTLGVDDIFRLMQGSADGRLLIDSPNAGNAVVIDDNQGGASTFAAMGFDNGGTTVENGITYDVHSFGDYQLLIDQNIGSVNVA
jgi:hypothetical protein